MDYFRTKFSLKRINGYKYKIFIRPYVRKIKENKEIKSPLRYPGGKSRVVQHLLTIFPCFNEFREPFVGGGSVFFAVKQQRLNVKTFLINDLNFDLYVFWKYAKEKNGLLVSKIIKLRESFSNGRDLYVALKNQKTNDELSRAARFFILNRISFSGLGENGGYSQEAYEKRFTDSSLERLRMSAEILKNVDISNEDYSKIINIPGESVFIFLDPPYYKAKKNRLYGPNGKFHTNFNHQKFARDVEKCQHKWLITYDDSDVIIDMFNFAYIYRWSIQYGMNNVNKQKMGKRSELIITNYEINSPKFQLIQKPI